MSEKVQLTGTGSAAYLENAGTPNEVTWVATGYTEPREALDSCVVCGEDIEEWELFVCLDGGETAHTGCVEIS